MPFELVASLSGGGLRRACATWKRGSAVGIVGSVRRVGAGALALALLSGCTATGPGGPRASQGDIAICVYVRGLSTSDPLGLRARGEGGIWDDVSDGELNGLIALAWNRPGGSERQAVLARCRTLGAI